MSEEPYQIRYDKARFPTLQRRPDGRHGCRGCGGEIPKGHSAWCGRTCKKLHHPTLVKSAVKRRDGGICQICGTDIFAPMREWRALWNTRAPLEAMPRRPVCKAEYDHIIPMCEGGMTVAENVRCLCPPCHRKETEKLSARRAARRRAEPASP